MVWMVFRLIGFLVLAPIVEELVFRGYLVGRFSRQAIDPNHRPAFSFWALGASSLLFGLLHDAWLAGFLAGIAFGWLRFRSEHLSTCILAHAVANGVIILLSVLSYPGVH